MTNDKFEPRILAFLCNWCCYAAADSAGVARLQYPVNIRVIRIMCTGRMDPLFIIDAFYAGVDGVFVGGCRLGECHYQVGNYDAIVTARFCRRILEHAGVKPERFALGWASAVEAPLFVELISKFTGEIRELGPLGKAEGVGPEELKLKLAAARSAVENVKLRIRFGRLAQDLRKANDHAPEVMEAKVAELNEAIIREMDKQMSALGASNS